ncbi:MAG: rhodanese-like domain-containing protein [Candidatus Eremiobacteraeota bacterium]|nr:rhodanese-like domain-containing protein [Candidatus Eremiobacteraeota bacterium]
MSEISATQLDQLRKTSHPHFLLDVREADEVQAAAIDGAVHIPMTQVAGRVHELPRDTELIVMCHHGQRSQRVAKLLQKSGFSNVKNLIGGINAWSSEVDPSVPTY